MNFKSYVFFHCPNHSLIQGNASGHDDIILNADALCQTTDAAGYCRMNAFYDIGDLCAACQLGNNLRFGKNGTGGADRQLLCRLLIEFFKVFQIDLQNLCDNIEEASRTGGAFIVHDKVFKHSVIADFKRL